MMLALIPVIGTFLAIVLFTFPSVITLPLAALGIPQDTSISLPLGLALAFVLAF